jgi:carbon monoxide dehydrogenase subunit G
MNLKGTHRLAFDRRTVWEALLDPEVLSRTLPGCESLERTADDTFAGRLKVAIGPVRGVFAGTLALTELDPPNAYVMKLDGRGPSGFMTGEGRVSLADDGDGTILAYDLEATVGGKLAAVGQRVLDSSAKAVAQQGLAGLERVLRVIAGEGGRGNGEGSGGPSARAGNGESAQPGGSPLPAVPARRRELPPPPSSTQFALAVARDTVADLVPKEQRLAIVALGLVVAGLFTGFLLGRSK